MNGAVTAAKMEPRGSSVSPLRTRKRSRTLGLRKTTHGSRSGRSNGRAECREKKIGIEPMENTFFLTFPLIGHYYFGRKHPLKRQTEFLVGTLYRRERRSTVDARQFDH